MYVSLRSTYLTFNFIRLNQRRINEVGEVIVQDCSALAAFTIKGLPRPLFFTYPDYLTTLRIEQHQRGIFDSSIGQHAILIVLVEAICPNCLLCV